MTILDTNLIRYRFYFRERGVLKMLVPNSKLVIAFRYSFLEIKFNHRKICFKEQNTALSQNYDFECFSLIFKERKISGLNIFLSSCLKH